MRPTRRRPRTHLVEQFSLSLVQAQAILDLQLRRLAALERQRIEDEYQEVMERITYLEDLLANPHKIRGLIRDDIVEMKEKYGDERSHWNYPSCQRRLQR